MKVVPDVQRRIVVRLGQPHFRLRAGLLHGALLLPH